MKLKQKLTFSSNDRINVKLAAEKLQSFAENKYAKNFFYQWYLSYSSSKLPKTGQNLPVFRKI